MSIPLLDDLLLPPPHYYLSISIVVIAHYPRDEPVAVKRGATSLVFGGGFDVAPEEEKKIYFTARFRSWRLFFIPLTLITLWLLIPLQYNDCPQSGEQQHALSSSSSSSSSYRFVVEFIINLLSSLIIMIIIAKVWRTSTSTPWFLALSIRSWPHQWG